MGDSLVRVFPSLWLRAGIGADDLPIHVRTQVFAYHHPARGPLDGRAAFGMQMEQCISRIEAKTSLPGSVQNLRHSALRHANSRSELSLR